MASISKIILQDGALTADLTSSAYALGNYNKDFVGVLVVSSCNAATTVNAKIQHSSDGSTWFDVMTFTAIVGVTGSEIKVPAVPLLSQVRSVIDLSGATLAATIKLELCFAGDK